MQKEHVLFINICICKSLEEFHLCFIYSIALWYFHTTLPIAAVMMLFVQLRNCNITA